RDDPRGEGSSSFSRLLPALPVAAALRLPPLLAVRGLAIASPCLPLPPPARFRLTRPTAIARHRLLPSGRPPPGPHQTDPAALGTTSPPGPPSGSGSASRILIFGRS